MEILHKLLMFSQACLLAALPGIAACGSSGGDSGLPVYELTSEAYSTLQRNWEPLTPSAETRQAMADDVFTVYDHQASLEAGLGVREAAGQAWIERDDLAPDFEEGDPAGRRSLAYIWLAADPQIIDEESPIRIEPLEILYRPNGHLSPQVWESHVRTARRVNDLSGRPFDFVLLAGDLTDGAQKNELSWTLDILAGGDIDPDSGLDDDPVVGPGNDYNDPFQSIGLDRPWYAAIGNHDCNYNGGFDRITDELREAATGRELFDFPVFVNGFCDGATLDAELRTEGPTPADPERIPLRREEFLAALHEAPGEPAGHGLTEADVATGRGYYSAHPIAGKPVRLVVLDTANSEPVGIADGSEGYCSQAQADWLALELDAATEARELVIVMSHHRPEDFGDATEVTGEQIREMLSAAPNVVLHLVGHGHANVKRMVPPAPATDAGGYWQIMGPSPLDFPLQSRVVELVWEGNGFLSIYLTNLDHNAPEDSLAAYARQLAGVKLAFGPARGNEEVDAYWLGQLEAQNLMLRQPLPAALVESLSGHEWPTRIESVDTLQSLH